MVSNFRQQEILELARRQGRVSVDDLAAQYDVTVQTIRRDLTALTKDGRVSRVHGGAILASGVVHIVYEERRRLNETGKQAIALACAAAIPDGASVFMNIGTTTEAVARALIDHKNLLVVTNNINIANSLAANPTAQIILTGGTLRRSDGGLVGGLTADMVQHFKFDFSVLGCSAIDEDGELLDYDDQEILVSKSALQRSRRVMVVADHQKFIRKAPLTICTLREVSCLFTDQAPPEKLRLACKTWGTDVMIGTRAP